MAIKEKLIKTASVPRWALVILVIALLIAGYYVGQHLSFSIDINTSWS